MLQWEHSAILLTFIKLPFVIKIMICLFLSGHFTQALQNKLIQDLSYLQTTGDCWRILIGKSSVSMASWRHWPATSRLQLPWWHIRSEVSLISSVTKATRYLGIPEQDSNGSSKHCKVTSACLKIKMNNMSVVQVLCKIPFTSRFTMSRSPNILPPH